MPSKSPIVHIDQTTNPYEHEREWVKAQEHMVNSLRLGDHVVYVRLFHCYDAGNISFIDLEAAIIRTDKGYEFYFDPHFKRYVVRGDVYSFLAMYFEEGQTAYRKYWGPSGSRKPLHIEGIYQKGRS